MTSEPRLVSDLDSPHRAVGLPLAWRRLAFRAQDYFDQYLESRLVLDRLRAHCPSEVNLCLRPSVKAGGGYV